MTETFMDATGAWSQSTWSDDNIAELSFAASSNTTITSLSLTLCLFTDRVNKLKPFLDLIRYSPRLELIEITQQHVDYCYGCRYHPDGDVSTPILSMVYEAAMRNQNSQLRSLRVNGIHGVELATFHKLLSLKNIQSLTIERCGTLESQIRHETSQVKTIASVLRTSRTLKKLCLYNNFMVHGNVITTSLYQHPTLEEIVYEDHFDSEAEAEALHGVFAVCASCPKIRKCTIIQMDWRLIDAACLLDGLRFSESLRFLHISDLEFVDVETVAFVRNDALTNLQFHGCRFSHRALSIIMSHLTGLQELSFKFFCDVIHEQDTSAWEESLSCLQNCFPNLKSLILERCHHGIHELMTQCLQRMNSLELLEVYNRSIELFSIFAHGPANLKIQSNNIFTKCKASEINRALEARTSPLKRFHFHYHSWEQGSLSHFSNNTVPMLGNAELLFLKFAQIDYFHKSNQDEIHQYVLSILEHLPPTATVVFGAGILDHDIGSCENIEMKDETAKLLLKHVKQNVHYRLVSFPQSKYSELISFYTELNIRGRSLLVERPSVPIALWPHVLAWQVNDRVPSSKYDDYYTEPYNQGHRENVPLEMMYELLKCLNGRVNLLERA